MNRYQALQHAVRAHRDQTDWGGQPYILHPMAVADRVEQHWINDEFLLRGGVSVESGVIVALLHDVWEDTEYMLPVDDLTYQQHAALVEITRYPDETYFDYINLIAECAEEGKPLAAIVKLADLFHNMSDERKVGLTDEQLERAAGLTEKRYIPSRDMLWEAIGSEWWPV